MSGPIDYSRLRSLTARDLISALRRDGFALTRQSGSHKIFHHRDGRRVTVSYHRSSDIFPVKTLKRMIEEEAQWTEEDLQRLKLLK
jgi:predicted RNA binding protein YcfA (HicA-like mRNA interferase family)